MKIKFTADSTVDLSKELIKKFDVEIIPLTVILGDKDYKDTIDIVPDDIYAYVEKTGILPKTSATNEELFYTTFKKYTDEGYTIIHFSISNKMSVSYENAVKAGNRLGNVFVVNGLSLSTGTSTLIAYAHRLLQKNYDAQTIFNKVNEAIPFVQASFVLDNLKYLHKGGRCSTVALLGANILKIKPCIAVKEGEMAVGKKYLGNFSNVVKDYVSDTLKNFNNYDPNIVFITHTKIDEKIVDMVKAELKEKANFKEIFETDAGSTITSHCGKNTIGILYINKKLDD